MLEKRLEVVTLVTALLIGADLTFGQTTTADSRTKVKAYQKEAQEKEKAGDFPAAITLYQRAIGAESDQREREGIQKDLVNVTRRFYIHLYQQAQLSSSREETIKYLIQARSLNIEGQVVEDASVLQKLGGWLRGGDTDFERVVRTSRELRQELFGQLRQEGAAAIGERAYDKAVLRYQQARKLDPELFNQQNLEAPYNKIRDQIKAGKQLALEGQRLVAQRKYQEAKEKLQRAQTLYPGQAIVAAGLKRIQSNGEIRKGLLALFNGQPEESIQILETVLKEVGEGDVQLHAFLGAVYCHRALMSVEPDMLSLETAREQFRRVLDLQPDYQLPRELFSPKILEIFEQLRSETQMGSIGDPDRHSE